jgi:colicin import membrane protein
MSLQVIMSAAVENGIRNASVDFAVAVINQLANEGALTCSVDEAIRMFNFEGVKVASRRSAAMKKVRASQKSSGKPAAATVRSKPEMVLPFCGVIEPSWCMGVRFNHGLHTQCTNGPMNGCRYCKTCQKSAANSASGKPQYGDIEDRMTGALLEYRDPKGKLTTCYANVAKKLQLDLGRAQEVAQAFGWEIPQDQLEVIKKKTGRPASNKPKKKAGKKGRPAKVKAPEQLSMDDQIAKLVAEAADDVLSVASSNESKKVVRVKKAKKAKKPKKTEEEKQAEKEAKEAAKAAAKAEKDAAKAKAKAEKDAAKAKAKAEKDAAKAKAKAEKDAAKAKKEQEKLLKAQALQKKIADATAEYNTLAQELSDETPAPTKLGELKKAIAGLKRAKREAAKAVKVAKPVAAEAKQETVVEPELTVEAVKTLQQTLAEDSVEEVEEDEEEITLDESTPKVEIDGTEYYKTKAYGLSAVLFTMEGECIGAYDETTGEIQELAFEDE